MDNSDSEVEFNHAQGDHENVNDSPRREIRGQQDDEQYDRHNRYDRQFHCCNRSQRPSIVIKPDPFTGEEDWEQYISHFEDCAELGQWNEKEMLLTLAASLKGQARIFYTSLPAVQKRSYRGLIISLEQRFGSARQQTRWLSKFQSRTKLYGESIAAFGDDLRLLARKAYSNLEPEAQEMLALQQFYKALSVEMRCRVMDRDCKTITAAVEVVERYEELLGDNTSHNRRRDVVRQVNESLPDSSYKSSSRWDRSYVNSSDELHKTLKSIQYRLDKIERRQGRPMNVPRTCFNCQSPDHFIRDCPNRHKLKMNDTNSKGKSNQMSGNGEESSL